MLTKEPEIQNPTPTVYSGLILVLFTYLLYMSWRRFRCEVDKNRLNYTHAGRIVRGVSIYGLEISFSNIELFDGTHYVLFN